eukprot:3321773-Prymnesium_polylepis.1
MRGLICSRRVMKKASVWASGARLLVDDERPSHQSIHPIIHPLSCCALAIWTSKLMFDMTIQFRHTYPWKCQRIFPLRKAGRPARAYGAFRFCGSAHAS